MPTQPATANADAWRWAVIEYIARRPDRPLKPRALARELRIAEDDYPQFRTVIRDMLSGGDLVLGPGRAVVLPDQSGTIVGTLRVDQRGRARIERPGRPAVLVQSGFEAGASDGDQVVARLRRRHAGRAAPAAEVTRILARRAPAAADAQPATADTGVGRYTRESICWVGVLERRGGAWVVQPQGKVSAPLVHVAEPAAKAAGPGDLVVVEPIQSAPRGGRLRGVIVETLGSPSKTRTKILGVIRRYRIPDEFPPAVRRAAQQAAAAFEREVAGDVSSAVRSVAADLPAAKHAAQAGPCVGRSADRGGREDLRGLTTITIDPPDARDFDDAISVRPVADGRVELGVHIADVAHFVPAGGAVEQEARRRGNSAYFPGYVVPMLPETLSNGVCSLQPGEPRFTKSVFLVYDDRARVVDCRFVEGVIQSARRLTYEEASRLLEPRSTGRPDDVASLLANAEVLARRILARRLREGMISLALPEVDIRLDRDGNVIDAGPAETSFSHTIIEMFMIEANEAVSRLLTRNGVPHLRRVHPPPQDSDGGPLRHLARRLGRKLSDVSDRHALQGLLDAARGGPAEPAVNLLVLRSMSQAVYSPRREGHFALASRDYCHFTSPIRRYPDLVNHRLLELCLRQNPGGRKHRAKAGYPSTAELAELGAHTSATERRAELAEREAKTMLLLEIIKGRIGEVLEGTVVGVASFGLFVQVRPYLVDGLVHVSELGGRDWRCDAQVGALIARRSRRSFGLGQRVRVRVGSVDEARGLLSLVPVDSE